MLQSMTARLSIAAAMLALGATAASGATRNFTIISADIVDLYSSTFDPALTPCPGSPPPAPPPAPLLAQQVQECWFFGGTTPAARAIVITPTGTGSGTMNVTYNDLTGEITTVNTLLINLPTMNLVISPPDQAPGTTVVNVTPGNGFPVSANGDAAFVQAGTGFGGRDLNGPLQFDFPPATVSQNTADPDQGAAIGQFSIFQHNDQPQLDTPDFAVFSEIVDSCVDNFPAANCGLITVDALSLDGVRYRMEGSVGCRASGHQLVLKTQTANNSIYRVNLTVTANDVDCDGDTVANAADNCPDVGNFDQFDTDGDLRGNMCDNCRTTANNGTANNGNVLLGAQCDSDADGFGNRCDGDYGNPPPGNGTTNSQDYILFRAQLSQPSASPGYNRADVNCNAVVNSQDYILFRSLLTLAPGPGAGP